MSSEFDELPEHGFIPEEAYMTPLVPMELGLPELRPWDRMALWLNIKGLEHMPSERPLTALTYRAGELVLRGSAHLATAMSPAIHHVNRGEHGR